MYHSQIFKNISYKFIRKTDCPLFKLFSTNPNYIQGQSPNGDSKNREYFYYIDHQGMLFLDDARIKNFTSCFKEKKFLAFFFSRLKKNLTDRYLDFPYVSPCGREINYVRCDDAPFVFTHVVDQYICYNHAGETLKEIFLPQKVTMNIENGRVYHPAPDRAGGIGLVKSSLAIEFSSRFRFANGENKPPTHFIWQNNSFALQSIH